MHISEKVYKCIIRFYPRAYRQQFGDEMHFVFTESLRDAELTGGRFAVFAFWLRLGHDAIKSLMAEHSKQLKGHSMKQTNTDVLSRNRIFVWIALSTVALLSVPLIAMQFTSEVRWTLSDFLLAGAVIFGMASLFVFSARRLPRQRLLLAIIFVVLFMYIWAELAVGIFTNLGS